MALLALIAFLGGVVPACVWLVFWLLEDRCEPEPKRYLFLCFVLGMCATLAVYYPERFVMQFFSGGLLLFFWAILEELFKFAAAYWSALRTRVYDEPIDAVVYMVTAALGFSALENTLFLWQSLQGGDIIHTIAVGDLRFMGAMLLHTLASATIGVALGLSFYKPAATKKFYLYVGVVLAICLHALFNFLILQGGSGTLFGVFLCIWVGITILLLYTEKLKIPGRDYC